MRAEWHCGWMPESDWFGTKPADHWPPLPRLEEIEYRENVCPGYAVRVPAVLEASEAAAFFEKGNLASWAPDPSHALLEAVGVLTSASNEKIAEHLRAMKK